MKQAITWVLLIFMHAALSFGQSSVIPPEPETAVQSVFKFVPTPNVRAFPFHSDLYAVAASSSNDIWAVGQSGIHFDGKQWSAFALPLVAGDGTSQLTGVADLASNDVWAVGNINIGEANPNQVIEHFNGAKWSVSPGPQFLPTDQPALQGLTATSATDMWAAGSILTLINGEPSAFPMFEHFDGASWTATIDEANSNCFMFGVSALASNDVWAVGNVALAATFIEHFDGAAWSVVRSPNPGNGQTTLNGVTALTPNDVWAVGWFVEDFNQDRPRKTLIEHWDGASWQIVPSPNVGGPNTQAFSNQLQGITAVSATDIWAFGATDALGPERITNLVLHWNGTDWSIATVPDPNPRHVQLVDDFLYGGIVIPQGDIWLVGVADGFGTMVLNATGQ